MKAIKGLVIFMGVLLIAGLVLLGYGLFNQAGKMGSKRVAPVAVQAGAGFGRIEVPVPAGAKVEDVIEADGKVVLRMIGGGPERFVVLDPDSGDVSGTFVLVPEAPAR